MREAHNSRDEDIVLFGPFQLNRTTCTLSKQGTTIALGSRAMGILMALTEQAGTIVSNRELLRRVWPNVVVEAGTIRVHVAQLRSVLRKADHGNEYVHNVTGQGYRIVVPVVRQPRSGEGTVARKFDPAARTPPRVNNLPKLITSVLGRDQPKSDLVELLTNKRLITVTGPGGIGKTTAAIVSAESFAEAHAQSVCFLDLATVERPEQIWSHLASTLGTSIARPDLESEVLTCLAQQSMVLVLDNCEHAVDSATRLAERVLRVGPHVKVLATSREPLRASAEVVYELAALDLPAAFDRLPREALLRHPAIKLFMERAGTEFDARELLLVGQICRRVAGNPLAIEIAAGQCRWLGLKALAGAFDDEMYLSMEGQRTAQSRHQTLRASFDWSYQSLSSEQQAVFQRLSELPGRFSVDRAVAAVADEQLTRRVVVKALVDLARKSLLVTDASAQDVSYGLHDLTRAYARSKLQHAQELLFSKGGESHLSLEAGLEHMNKFVGLWQSARSDRVQ